MSQDFSNGRAVVNFLYTFLALCLIGGAIVKKDVLLAVRIALILSQLICGCLLLFTGREEGKKQWLYRRFQVLACLMQAYGLCMVFGSWSIISYVMLQSLAMLAYLDYKLCYFQFFVTSILVIVAKLLSLPGIHEDLSVGRIAFSLGGLAVMEWLAVNIAKSFAFRERDNMEKERSLDDLLKVIEVKCDEAMQATKSKSDFLSNMSHEIRTPINAILGMNEMILRESKEEEITGYAVNVEQSGKMLLSIINEILDLSKIESGKMEIVPVEYKLSSVLNDALNMVKERAEKKGLVLKLEADPEVPDTLFGDEIRIRQILTNILTNGVKYTNEGTITLIVNYEKTENDNIILNVQVKDTGIGIKEEDQADLFVAFQRLEQVNNRHIEGTGLGLPITAHLVEMMQGSIGVESVYGEGSCFTVQIPQKVVSYEPMGDFKKKFRDSTQERKSYHRSFIAPEAKILIVDDNEMNLKVAKALLKDTLVQVTLCESGQSCLNLLKEQMFDLILLDHMMPVMDGIETLKHIKEMENPDCRSIPVIALTANAISGVRSMYLEAGFDNYLSKPIVGSDLEALLCKYVPQEKIQLMNEEEVPDEKAAATVDTSEEKTRMVDVSEEKPAASGDEPDSDESKSLLNVESGLAYSGDSEEIYAEFLAMFRDMQKEKAAALQGIYEAEDVEQYAILIHAIKSNAFSIGGNTLGELAQKLEAEAKAKNWDFVKQHHAEALDLFEKTAEEATAWLKEHSV